MRNQYHGVRRDNVPVTGWTTENVATFTENKYRAGWRQLSVIADDDGSIVGSIDINEDTGRIWWAEDI